MGTAHMRKTAVVACTAVLVLTGCGTGDADQAKANIKANILDKGSVIAGVEPTEEQAGCLADGMVDEVGVEKLQDYQLLDDDLKVRKDGVPDDMSKDDADALAGVVVQCVDVAKLIEDQLDKQAASLSDEQRTCLSDAIDEDAIKAGLAASFQGEDEDNPMNAMRGEMLKCVMPGGATG